MVNLKNSLFILFNKIVKVFPTNILARYAVLRSLNMHVINILKPGFVENDGHKIFLDAKDSLRLSIIGDHEPLIKEVICKEVKEGDVVLDIGANIGYFSLILAKRVGPSGKVFAFEPDPDNYKLLNKNIKVNGYGNIYSEQTAVSDVTGKINLYLEQYNTGDHRIYDSFDCRKAIQINSVTLDDYFRNYNGMINFIKMDVQGAEGKVLKGMLQLLEKNKNIKIVAEFWAHGLLMCGVGPDEFLSILIRHNFLLYDMDDGYRVIRTVNIPDFIRKYTGKTVEHTNILCVRSL